MEHHRLKPLKEGYDQKLFNDIYKKLTPLIRKLAFEIDARKFGVDYDEVVSWFTVKFIHSFNKYHDTEPERLMGYLINSLTTYKYRIIKSSYQLKYHDHANMVDVTELYNQKDLVEDEEVDKELYLGKVMEFLKTKLNDDAMLILQIELCPPQYIIDSLDDMDKKPNSVIPHELIADYLGQPDSDEFIKYIKELRSEIKYAVNLAKKFFIDNPISI